MLRQQHENSLPSIAAFLPRAQQPAAAAAATPQSESYAVTAFKKHLQKTAEKDANPYAYYRLGLCFAHGYGVQKNEARAVDYYEKAIARFESEKKMGDPRAIEAVIEASYQLGLCYANGYGVNQDEAKARQHYARVDTVSRRFRRALFHHNRMLFNHVRRSRLELALYYSIDTQDEDNYRVMHDVTSIDHLFSLKRDDPYVLVKQALLYTYDKYHADSVYQLLTDAVSMGDTQACYILGRYSMLGIHDAERNPSKAFRLFQKASQQGHNQAMVELGLCYHHGYGTPKDEKKAVSLFKQAADQNNAEAKTFLSADAKELISKRNPHTAYRVVENTKADDEKGQTHRQGREALEKIIFTRDVIAINKLPSPFDYTYGYVYLLLSALKTNHALSELDFGDILLEEDALFSLSEALGRDKNPLRSLSLKTQRYISNESLLALAKAMTKPSAKLHTLKLELTPGHSDDSDHFIAFDLLNYLLQTKLCTLHVHNLEQQTIDSDTIDILRRNKTLAALKLVNLLLASSDKSDKAAVSTLIYSLCDDRFSRPLDDSPLNELALINIQDCSARDAKPVHSRVLSIMPTLNRLLSTSNLTHLDLTYTLLAGIDEEKPFSLSVLSESKALTSLNLSKCFFSSDAATLAVKHISVTSIKKLIFNENCMDAKTLILLFQSKLCELILRSNEFFKNNNVYTQENNREAREALSQNSTLTSLEFSSAGYSTYALGKALGEALFYNTTLRKFLCHIPVSPAALRLFVMGISILDCPVSSQLYFPMFTSHLAHNTNLISFTENGADATIYFTRNNIEEKERKEVTRFVKKRIEKNRLHLTAWQRFALYNLFIQASPLSAHRHSIIPLLPIISQFMNEYPAESPLSFSDSAISQSRFFAAQLVEAKERRGFAELPPHSQKMRGS